MARTTRSKASAPAKSISAEGTPAQAEAQTDMTLPEPAQNPPRIFILPSAATTRARVVLLLCPRTAKPSRYLVCPESGIYEFTRVAAPKSTPRSWLVETPQSQAGPTIVLQSESQSEGQTFGASVTKGADLFVATMIDPLFLVLPAVAAAPTSTSAKNDGKKLFLSGDDHFDSIAELSPHLSEIIRWGDGKIQKLLESRMAAICDTVDAGDELMFRFSEEKLLAELLNKARSLAAQPLPKSMEEKFVTKALEAPVIGVRVRETIATRPKIEVAIEPASEEKDSDAASTPRRLETGESQSSVSSTETGASVASVVSATSTAATEVVDALSADLIPAIHATPEIVTLQRLRVAFLYICSAYLAPTRAASVKSLLASISTDAGPSVVDFEPLDAYLAKIAKMREDAASARSMSDYSRKRVLDDDEVADKAEKKRLKEDEDRRKKAGESRGVKNLKKVNTTGMKKMSAFFGKKA
ncbi:RNase H2 complex component wHTH domain-containing protein [Microdochium nivale]|nr:RNase H2 complex component wHTH domain-containing protein [Microdochium nivale]